MSQPSDAELESVCRFAYGGGALDDFQVLLGDSETLRSFLGQELWLRARAGASDSLRRDVRRAFERLWPGVLLSLRAHQLCAAILGGALPMLVGLRELSALRRQPGGERIIPLDFVALDSETDAYPTPSQYALWEPKVLAERIAALERFRPSILEAARVLLDATK